MDTVAGFLNQQNSFKVKAISQVQLALSLIATAWEPNVTGAVAVLGILASILGNSELLQLYFVFTPVSIIIDIFQILFYRPIGFGMWFGVMFLTIIAKVAGTYFAYLMSNSSPDDEAGYQSFAGGAQGTRSQRDPFSGGYQPPPTNPFVQPSAGGSPQRRDQSPEEHT
ncbi:hypothetical protein ABBQ38_003914 [Trebouxia sp. C0009 RCD-2024]